MAALFTPDVEELLVDHLPPLLAAHRRTPVVAASIPNPMPPELIVCPQIPGGGRKSLVLDTAVIAFEAWAKTDGKAKSLALALQGVVLDLPGSRLGGAFVYRVTEFAGSPGALPDPDSRGSRYVWTATITVRAKPA